MQAGENQRSLNVATSTTTKKGAEVTSAMGREVATYIGKIATAIAHCQSEPPKDGQEVPLERMVCGSGG
jgi:hypothetical protein